MTRRAWTSAPLPSSASPVPRSPCCSPTARSTCSASCSIPTVPDEPLLVDDLVRYFPRPMQTALRPAIERHRLRREIIATHVTNSIVNRVGPGFVARLSEETGALVSDIARAYTAARDVFAMRSLWEEIEALDNKLPVDQQNRMWLESIRTGRTRHPLVPALRRKRPLDVSACIDAVRAMTSWWSRRSSRICWRRRAKTRVRRRTRRWRELGVPRQLAERVAGMDHAALPPATSPAVPTPPAFRGRKGGQGVLRGRRTLSLRPPALRRQPAGRRDSPWLQSGGHRHPRGSAEPPRAGLTRQVVSHREGRGTGGDRRLGSKERSAKPSRTSIACSKDFEAGTVDLAILAVAERQLRRLVGE